MEACVYQGIAFAGPGRHLTRVSPSWKALSVYSVFFQTVVRNRLCSPKVTCCRHILFLSRPFICCPVQNTTLCFFLGRCKDSCATTGWSYLSWKAFRAVGNTAGKVEVVTLSGGWGQKKNRLLLKKKYKRHICCTHQLVVDATSV